MTVYFGQKIPFVLPFFFTVNMKYDLILYTCNTGIKAITKLA